MLWQIELKFCIWLSLNEHQIKFECHQFLYELCRFWDLEYWKYSFHTFLCAFTYWTEILYDFHLMNFRLKSSVINFVIFCWNNTRFGTENFKYSFPHSCHIYVCFDILSLNVVYDFLFMNFRSSDWHYLRSNLKELCPYWMFSFAHFSCACLATELEFLIWLYFVTHYSISNLLCTVCGAFGIQENLYITDTQGTEGICPL